MGRFTYALIAVMLVAGCGGDDESEPVPTAPSTVEETPPPNPAVKECAGASRSSGTRVDLNSRQNVRAGPVLFYYGRQNADVPSSEFEPVRLRGERAQYLAIKQLLLISGTRPVTLEVPPGERAHASLLYKSRRSYTPAEQRRGLAQIRDGYPAVRFEPCTSGRGPFTEVPGGLVVAGTRCLPLYVWVEGRKRPIRRVFSYGRGDAC